MGFGSRYYAIFAGSEARKLPAGKINKDLPVLPELAGEKIKLASAVVEFENRVAVKIACICLDEHQVREDGVVNFSQVSLAAALEIGAALFGGPGPLRKKVLLGKRESRALIDLMKQDLGDRVVAEVPEEYLWEVGIQPPLNPFRLIEGGEGKGRRRS